LEVLEECGHIPQEEQPQKTIARISEFLRPDLPQ
jgi:pimeloyl-ACP methyl ester carboxylesterase